MHLSCTIFEVTSRYLSKVAYFSNPDLKFVAPIWDDPV